MLRILIVLFLPFVAVGELSAMQTPANLAEGQRIRIGHRCEVSADQEFRCSTRRRSKVEIGYILSIELDSIRFRPEFRVAEVAIPTHAVTGLWVVEGRRSHFWTGAGIGLMAGAVIGAVIGSTQEFCIFSCTPATGIGLILGAPAGLIVGGFVGAVVTSDRWVTVPIAGVGIGLSVQQGTIVLTLPAPI